MTDFSRALAPALLILSPALAAAGPPYQTDDPEPVELHHWEIYLASQHALTADGAEGTLPHLEVNFGALPGLQLHAITPLAYSRPEGGPASYGVGDVELGAKYRFLEEGEWWPMVGTFPQLELPTGDAAKGLGTGRLHLLVPLWLQKSFGPWLSYGGGGYWWNPGEGNQNHWFFGWLVQRRLASLVSAGAELVWAGADRVGGSADLRANLGAVFDFGEHHHLLLSAGRSLAGDTRFQGYLAYQATL